MVRLDGRKLTAPLLAQAVAFVAVLVIGGLTGHAGGKPAHPSSPGSTKSSPNSGVHSRGTTSTGQSTELTVRIDQVGGFGQAMPSVALKVLKDDVALIQVASTNLPQSVPGTAPEAMESVLVGHAYQVCVKPPPGWTFIGHGTGALPGWDCTEVEAGSQPLTVTFQLTPRSPNAGTVSP